MLILALITKCEHGISLTVHQQLNRSIEAGINTMEYRLFLKNKENPVICGNVEKPGGH